MNILTKFAATGLIATLLVPTLAFAHEGSDNGSLQVRLENKIERIEQGGQNDEREVRHLKNATSTAASITKKATKIQLAADTMLSFNARIAALIASSSADVKTGLQAKFTEFTNNANSAKTNATAALTAAGQVSTTSSTTTAATLLAQAKVDLKEATGFLHDAKKVLFSILNTLWN